MKRIRLSCTTKTSSLVTETMQRRSSEVSELSEAKSEALCAWRIIYRRFVNIVTEKSLLDVESLTTSASNLVELRNLIIHTSKVAIQVEEDSEPQASSLDSLARVGAQFIKLDRIGSVTKRSAEDMLFNSFSTDSNMNGRYKFRKSELNRIKLQIHKNMNKDNVTNAILSKWKPHQIVPLKESSTYEIEQETADSGIRKTVSMFRASITEKEIRAYQIQKKEEIPVQNSSPKIKKQEPEPKAKLRSTRETMIIPK